MIKAFPEAVSKKAVFNKSKASINFSDTMGTKGLFFNHTVHPFFDESSPAQKHKYPLRSLTKSAFGDKSDKFYANIFFDCHKRQFT